MMRLLIDGLSKTGANTYALIDMDQKLSLEYFGVSAKRQVADNHALVSDISGKIDGEVFQNDSFRILKEESGILSSGVQQVTFTLEHKKLPVTLELRYTAWGDTGMFSRDIKLLNTGDRPLTVNKIPSLSWDLGPGKYTDRYLWGSWGQERQLAAETLSPGGRSFGSSYGQEFERIPAVDFPEE